MTKRRLGYGSALADVYDGYRRLEMVEHVETTVPRVKRQSARPESHSDAIDHIALRVENADFARTNAAT